MISARPAAIPIISEREADDFVFLSCFFPPKFAVKFRRKDGIEESVERAIASLNNETELRCK